jgi:hypothetical protein
MVLASGGVTKPTIITMKKIPFIIGLFCLVTFGAVAQSSNDGRGGFGIRGGANFFNFGGADASNNDYDNRIGYHFGLYNSFFLGESLAIEPGVYYSVKGTQNDNLIKSRSVLGYVDVPLIFRVYFSEGLNFFGGGQVSFLTSSRFEGDFFGSTYGFDTEAINKTDYGVLLGVGYTLPKGLNVQASYDLGLNPVFKNSNAEIYNRGFKVSLGYTF